MPGWRVGSELKKYTLTEAQRHGECVRIICIRFYDWGGWIFDEGLMKNRLARTNNENLEEYLCAFVPL